MLYQSIPSTGEAGAVPESLTVAATADCTNSVVASCVVLVPRVAVGAAGTPVKVGDPSVASVPVVGKVTFVAAVAVRVVENAPEVAKVEPSAKVSVADVAGAVTKTLFMLVADATPIVGVVSVGEVDRTTLPVPVIEVKSVSPASQSAAVVRAVPIQVIIADRPEIIEITKLSPDEFTVRVPVLLFTIWKDHPVDSVLVTGRVIV